MGGPEHILLALAKPPDPFFRAALYLLLLVLGLAVCLFALLRLSRRYREQLLRKEGRPTAAPDIWRMHKPPEDAEPGDAPEESDGER